ncbi:MAG TPA: hypothetical protein PKL31_00040 [Fulvivirga sp.]|nr:hypothetical protein [Fulvivirga sp.]
MELQKLVIASVLKPVTDTRMYEKFGRSISQAKKYEVNIIGFYSKKIPNADNIYFHPIFKFKRIGIKRILAPLQYLVKLLAIRPVVIIITTHELLIPSLIFKVFFRAKLIYDVRENYFLNIRHTNAFPNILRDIIAYWVRFKETLTSSYVQHFTLAEKCYENELTFIGNKYNIIENKALSLLSKSERATDKNNEVTKLVFTGTLAESTGVFHCIKLAQNLHQMDDSITLNIIGYCSSKAELVRIKNAINNKPYITLQGGDNLVEHSAILDAINNADFGLIYYPPNVANDNAIPTKLYEYLSAELPILMEDKPSFISITAKYPAAIVIDFNDYNSEQILAQMRSANFYATKPGSEVLWRSEEVKLLMIINS